MKKNLQIKLLLAAFVCTFYGSLFAQSQDSSKITELKKIYSNLEYNTSAFNDLKKKWYIDDPAFIREIFNRFVVNKALRLNGKNVGSDVFEQKIKEIYNSRVVIDVRKRYYDDEIEYLAFMPESEIDKEKPELLFDAVDDGFYLKQVLGQKLYSKIQSQSYYLSNITKTDYNSKAAYSFDLRLNLLETDIMFWSTTSDNRNKYLLSFFGDWGNDNIFLPGWNYGQGYYGFKLDYHKLLDNDPENYTYRIKIGSGIPMHTPFDRSKSLKPIAKSAFDVYLNFSGQPFEFISKSLKNLYLLSEAMIPAVDLTNAELKLASNEDFYAPVEFYSLKLEKKNIFSLADFGMLKVSVGYSYLKMEHDRFDPQADQAVRIDSGKATSYYLAEIGAERLGGLLQHDTKIHLGYNSADKYGYWGISSKIMISDSFGIDFRYYRSFELNTNDFPWRKSYYFVFSPVLRINY
ncbi:MAG: hypothetical protein HF314_07365 [Ignavibacteria bacterium]|jgi:hypothetical protein|nr:hypothetical protein [Ignavibacteria bacterium]MCU7502874.1 hypothetical protein [Ignavibacteria bacterium]MCU7515632.1 hypothetical protein [Ignavibacteria bacterium]